MFCYFIDAENVISAPFFDFEMPSRRNSQQSNAVTIQVQDVEFVDLGETADIDPIEAVLL